MRIGVLNNSLITPNFCSFKKGFKISDENLISKPFINLPSRPEYWQKYNQINSDILACKDKYALLQDILADYDFGFKFAPEFFSAEEYDEIITFLNDNPQSASVYIDNLYFVARNSKETRKTGINYRKQNFLDMTRKLNSDETANGLYSKAVDVFSSRVVEETFVLKMLENYDPEFLNAFFDKAMENKETKKYVKLALYNPIEALTTFDVLDKENLDDYFVALKNEEEKNNHSLIASHYINPYTRRFDINVYNSSQKFNKILPSSGKELACLCFDGQSKEFSSDIEKALLKILQILVSKDKSNVNYLGSDLRNTSLYLRDGTGEFSKTHSDAILKMFNLINSPDYQYHEDDLNTLNSLFSDIFYDDEFIESEFDFIYNLANESKSISKTFDIYSALSDYDNEKRKYIYDTLLTFSDKKEKIFDNFVFFADFAFDLEGEIIKSNSDFLKKLLKTDNKGFSTSFLNLANKYPKQRDFILELASWREFNTSLRFKKDFMKFLIKEDGSISSDDKARFRRALPSLEHLDDFHYLYKSAQIKDEKGRIVGFDDYSFNLACGYSELLKNGDYYSLAPWTMVEIFQNKIDFSKLNFSNKLKILKAMKHIQKTYPSAFAEQSKLISDCLVENISYLQIDKKDKTNFISSILKSNDGELTDFETALINAIPALEANKTGLKLEYSKIDYLNSLSSICDDVQFYKIIEKLAIEPVIQNGKMVDYNGIIQLDNLNLDDELEHQIYDISHKFMYENSISTSDSELDNYLNQIIKALPEFINIIGKKQHVTHDHTLDIHILLTLAYAIQNPKYHQLTQKDKSIMKFAILLHDISKQYATVDENHPKQSASYARKISSKIFNSTEIQDRIYELILNHHWTKEYNASNNLPLSQKMAFNFRRPNDFNIAQIMADYDIKAVSPALYKMYGNCIDNEGLAAIEQNINRIHSSSSAICTHKIVSPHKLKNHIVEYDGRKYALINLNALWDDDLVDSFGFSFGLTKKDLRFLVHMVSKEYIKDDLDKVKYLSSPLNGGVLSMSLISPIHDGTYQGRSNGVILSQSNSNLINMSSDNQSSGTQKDYEDMLHLIFSSHHRKFYLRSLVNKLDLNLEKVSDLELAEFYRKYLANLYSIKEIYSKDEYSICGVKFSPQRLEKAILEIQDGLIHTKDTYLHNELIGYVPKIEAVISKAKSIDNVPNGLLEFAYENNLPVVLI